MQADKNVLVLKNEEKEMLEKDIKDLDPDELNTLIGDSSAFSSENYEPYIDELQSKLHKNHKTLSDREEKLISGVFLKE